MKTWELFHFPCVLRFLLLNFQRENWSINSLHTFDMFVIYLIINQFFLTIVCLMLASMMLFTFLIDTLMVLCNSHLIYIFIKSMFILHERCLKKVAKLSSQYYKQGKIKRCWFKIFRNKQTSVQYDQLSWVKEKKKTK